jgi:hypothetical protein
MPNYFNCLLIGEPGVGKTTAAATAPGPILYLDVDNKLHKMRSMDAKIAKGEIIQWGITEPLSETSLLALAKADIKIGAKFVQKIPKGYYQLAEMIDKLSACACVVEHQGKPTKVATVVLDSYTSLNEHLKRLLTACNGTTTMTQPLWGTFLTDLETLNNALLNLPANIIFIAHQKPDKDDLTGTINYRPLIDGAMRDKIGKDFEEIYFMEKSVVGGKAVYEMLTVGTSMKTCRTSRVLPSRAEPNFTKIYGETEQKS